MPKIVMYETHYSSLAGEEYTKMLKDYSPVTEVTDEELALLQKYKSYDVEILVIKDEEYVGVSIQRALEAARKAEEKAMKAKASATKRRKEAAKKKAEEELRLFQELQAKYGGQT